METTTNNFLEGLVVRAIADTEQARIKQPKRRPTWAPPIPFEQELAQTIKEIEALWIGAKYECAYGRLWAQWQNPRYFKNHADTFAGFDLVSGKGHKGVTILRVRRNPEKQWVVVKRSTPLWARSLADREAECRSWYYETEEALQGALVRARERFERDNELYAREIKYHELLPRASELGAIALAKFAEAPDEVMRVGGQISGICCICGRTLTDPTSVRLGIGPECIKGPVQ